MIRNNQHVVYLYVENGIRKCTNCENELEISEYLINQPIFVDFSGLGDPIERVPFTVENTHLDTGVQYPQHVILRL